MSRCRFAGSRLLFAAAGLAFGLLGSELTFGSLRRPAPPVAAVLYSVEVRNGAGALLASPLLVGKEGQPVHLEMWGPHSEPAMSLDLTPLPAAGGNLCVGYRLSFDHGSAHAGSVGVAFGERRSVRLREHGQLLQLSFVVARAHSPAFGQLLLRRRRPTT